MMMMMMEHSAIDLSNRVRAVICPCPFYWVQQSSVYRVYLGMYTVGKRRRVLAILMTRVLARAQSAVLSYEPTYTYMYRLQLRLARGQTQTLLH